MRKHGWQLPYHPLQVVAVAVFLALGFAFYVFFAPFVGRRLFQYIAVGLYTPLIISVFGLYIWCAAADPADPGVFKSKKYLKISDSKIHTQLKEAKLGGDLTPSLQDESAVTIGGKHVDKSSTNLEASVEDHSSEIEKTHASSHPSSCLKYLLAFVSCASLCHCSSFHDESSEHQPSEDGMFYCSLCEVEVFKYSKHCRVCDKCVNRFDHHCRWLNNCIGRKNYRQFFTLMVTALVLLILQWTTGILVLISCVLEHKRFSVDIASKLGSSFTLPPFIIVVGMCSILAMIATLPLAQLFFFHILLIKKGISTYDYIIALREQEQQGAGGQQSAQMSPASSLTGLSSASSFNTFQRTAWCTPPRLFLEDQFDVVPPDTGSVSSLGKKSARDEPLKKKNPAAVKISPWALARLNAEEVSRVAAEARKKSKILQPVSRRNNPPGPGTDSRFGSGDRRMGTKLGQIPDSNSSRRRPSKRVRLPAGLLESSGSANGGAGYNMGNDFIPEPSTSLAPLQLEARNAFRTSLAMSGPAGVVGSSPESSLESPDLHPFRISSSGPDEGRQLAGPLAAQKGFPLSRSTSDGYEASGGEDSDRVPSRNVERTMNWSNLLFRADRDERPARLKGSTSSSGQVNLRNL